MEDFDLLVNIIIQYKYSKKQLEKNIINLLILPNESYDDESLRKYLKAKIIKVIFDIEMLFYEAENEILMKKGYLDGKIALDVSNITKGKYRNKFYFSDLLNIKKELL